MDEYVKLIRTVFGYDALDLWSSYGSSLIKSLDKGSDTCWDYFFGEEVVLSKAFLNLEKYAKVSEEKVHRSLKYLYKILEGCSPYTDYPIYSGGEFKYKKGETITLDSLNYFSTKESVANQFASERNNGNILVIDNNTRGILIKDAVANYNKWQYEVLVPKGSQYNVKKKSGNKIFLTEI